jgi:DNA-binding transcriptional MocR family regulator
MSDGRRHRLAELAQSSEAIVIQDDTYGEIFFEDPAPRLLIGLGPQNVIHVGSFSKTLAPGLRLGWLAGPKAIMSRIAAMRTDLGGPALIQKTVARLMEDGDFDRRLGRALPHYLSKRDSLLAALDDCCAGLGQWNTPRGGFFIWFVLASGDVDHLAQAAMTEGVRFLSGPYFSSHQPDRRGVRLAYGELSADNLVEGAHRFSRAIQRSQREPSRLEQPVAAPSNLDDGSRLL